MIDQSLVHILLISAERPTALWDTSKHESAHAERIYIFFLKKAHAVERKEYTQTFVWKRETRLIDVDHSIVNTYELKIHIIFYLNSCFGLIEFLLLFFFYQWNDHIWCLHCARWDWKNCKMFNAILNSFFTICYDYEVWLSEISSAISTKRRQSDITLSKNSHQLMINTFCIPFYRDSYKKTFS